MVIMGNLVGVTVTHTDSKSFVLPVFSSMTTKLYSKYSKGLGRQDAVIWCVMLAHMPLHLQGSVGRGTASEDTHSLSH